jgi:hypothetical protein
VGVSVGVGVAVGVSVIVGVNVGVRVGVIEGDGEIVAEAISRTGCVCLQPVSSISVAMIRSFLFLIV